MGLYKTKIWLPLDIAFLKWASILFGMILGAYLSSFVKQYLWIFILLIIAFSIRIIYSYCFKK